MSLACHSFHGGNDPVFRFVMRFIQLSAFAVCQSFNVSTNLLVFGHRRCRVVFADDESPKRFDDLPLAVSCDSRHAQRIWSERGHGLILRRETFTPDGRADSRMRFLRVRVELQP